MKFMRNYLRQRVQILLYSSNPTSPTVRDQTAPKTSPRATRKIARAKIHALYNTFLALFPLPSLAYHVRKRGAARSPPYHYDCRRCNRFATERACFSLAQASGIRQHTAAGTLPRRGGGQLVSHRPPLINHPAAL